MLQSTDKSFFPSINKGRNFRRVSKILRLIFLQANLIALLGVSACAKSGIKDGSDYLATTPFSTTLSTTPYSTTPSMISTEAVEFNNVQEPFIGIWISKKELATLPTSGAAWEAVKVAADKDPGTVDVSDQDQNNDIYVLAKALVYARTGELKYREEVIDNLMKAVDTEKGGRTLALGRNMPGYIISADLVNLPADPNFDSIFRSWLRRLLTENLDGKSLQSTQEDRPNNWGTHAGAARAAIALYLGDRAELERTAAIFHGYLGDTSVYNGFTYGADLSWQCDPYHPVGVNPSGCLKEGHVIDGALPEEMRRGGGFQWPPITTGYAWEALQGAFVQAEILNRAGFPTWDWQDKALLRAANFLYSIDWKPEGDDEWMVWLINYVYKTSFPVALPANPGKNMGWTDWTYSKP
jgi:hypothetical protein